MLGLRSLPQSPAASTTAAVSAATLDAAARTALAISAAAAANATSTLTAATDASATGTTATTATTAFANAIASTTAVPSPLSTATQPAFGPADEPQTAVRRLVRWAKREWRAVPFVLRHLRCVLSSERGALKHGGVCVRQDGMR